MDMKNPEEARKHRVTNNEYWAVRYALKNEKAPKFRRTRKMMMENPIWPKEVQAHIPESWEKLPGRRGAEMLPEILDGLRSLRACRHLGGQLFQVLRPVEPDGEGRGEQGPARPNARPLDTPWSDPYEFDQLDITKASLPIVGITDKTLREAVEGAQMVGNDPTRDVNMDRPSFEAGSVPSSSRCLEMWLHRNFK